MRFTSIEIHNYRQFREFTLDFPHTKACDLHVIIGSNGVGKTNMLNAINWCLYDEEPHLGKKSAKHKICNISSAGEAKATSQKYVTVKVVLKAEQGNDNYIFSRRLQFNVNTNFAEKSVLTVQIISPYGAEEFDGDEADRLVNNLIPAKIKEYYFFDGEHLDDYFDEEKTNLPIKDSIYEVAQINVVKKAREHLNSVAADYRKDISRLSPDFEGVEKKLKDAECKRDGKKLEIQALNDSITTSKEKIAQLTKLINHDEHVVEDNKKYVSNKGLIEEHKKTKKRLYCKLRDLVRKYYVIFSLYEINKSTSDYIQKKFDAGDLPPEIDPTLIELCLSTHKCSVCGSNIDDKTEKELREKIKLHNTSNAVGTLLTNIKNDVYDAYHNVEKFVADRDEILDKIDNEDEEIARLEEENEGLSIEIRKVSNIEEIGTWMQERNEHYALIESNNRKLGSYEENLKTLEEAVKMAQDAHKKATEGDKAAKTIREYLDFTTEASSILGEIEDEVTSDVRKEMENRTMELFEPLLWKEKTYDHIELDENYHLSIYDKRSGESCLGSMSSAERELLALAFTLSLHDVSKRDVMIYIDTPVSRVDPENRRNFAKSLVKISERVQLILAFTPSEFSAEIQEYFTSETLSSKYELSTINEEKTIITR